MTSNTPASLARSTLPAWGRAGALAALVLLLSLLSACGTPAGQTTRSPLPRALVYTASAPGVPVPGAWSMLDREATGLTMQLHAVDLPIGTVVTVGWIIFNHPQYCRYGDAFGSGCGMRDASILGVQASVVYAAGLVVGQNGTGDFAARLAVRDASQVVSGPGLLNPLGADIHLLVNSAGKPLRPELEDQLHAFHADCSVTTCLQITEHEVRFPSQVH